MIPICVEDHIVDVMFNDFKELAKSVNDEVARLNNLPGRVAFDNTPTDNKSIFGSRNMVMHHIVQTIKAYVSESKEAFSVDAFYIDIYRLYGLNKLRVAGYVSEFQELIDEYDEKVKFIKAFVDAYKDANGSLTSTQLYKMELTVYSIIDELYDVLIDAKRLIPELYKKSNTMVLEKVLMRYLEIGTDIFNEPVLFNRETDMDKLEKEIKERHAKLKKWALTDHISEIDV